MSNVIVFPAVRLGPRGRWWSRRAPAHQFIGAASEGNAA